MTALARGVSSVAVAASRFVRAIALILLYYLVQVCVLPHLKVLGVMPNLLMVCVAILTVSYGKLFAFISGAVIGILLESMARVVPLLYVLVYPVLALVFAQMFADMTDVQREYRRIRDAQRKSDRIVQLRVPMARRKLSLRLRRDTSRDVNPHLRILLNALSLCLAYDAIMLVYIALRGIPITGTHLLRSFWALAYTAVGCLSMFPARAFLGLYRKKRPALQSAMGTQEMMEKRMVLVPDDAPLPKPKKKIMGLFGGRATASKPAAPDPAPAQQPPAPAQPEDTTDED